VTWHARTLWLESPSLIALFVAGATFYAVTGLGRDTTAGASTVVSRYVYVGVAILTPVIAKVLSSASGWPVARLAVLVLLAVTVIGNVGQAETWAKSRVAVTSSLKVQLEAVARLLASGTQDVSGPGASPIGLFPDLSAASIDRMERSGQLPAAPLTRAELVNARALLAVGTWDGSKTGLSPAPLFSGHFRLVTAAHSATSLQANGCYDFDPETVSPAMQVWLRLSAGERSASVRVSSSPAAPGVTNHLAALLVPPEGPASTDAVQLAIPAGGTGYLSDNDPGADLVLLWDVGTPLELCGLSGGPHH